MKKMMSITIVTALLLSGTLFAQPRGGNGICCDGPGMNHMGMKGKGHTGMKKRGQCIEHLLRIGGKIELTDSQREELKQLSVDLKLDKIELTSELKKEEVLLKALLREEDSSERDVFSAIDKVAALKADLKKMKYSHKQTVKNVLTDEQIEKLKKMKIGRIGNRFMDDDDDLENDKPMRGRRGYGR